MVTTTGEMRLPPDSLVSLRVLVVPPNDSWVPMGGEERKNGAERERERLDIF